MKSTTSLIEGNDVAPHETGIATSAGPAGMFATVAYCTCGWRGGAYRTRPETQAAADQHAKENA